jgi:hypothetical protein
MCAHSNASYYSRSATPLRLAIEWSLPTRSRYAGLTHVGLLPHARRSASHSLACPQSCPAEEAKLRQELLVIPIHVAIDAYHSRASAYRPFVGMPRVPGRNAQRLLR